MMVPDGAYPGEVVIMELPMDFKALSEPPSSRHSGRKIAQTSYPEPASARKLEPSTSEPRRAVHNSLAGQDGSPKKETAKTATVDTPKKVVTPRSQAPESSEIEIPESFEGGDDVIDGSTSGF